MRCSDSITVNGHEFEETPEDSGGQKSLAYCSPWSCKESDTTAHTHRENWDPHTLQRGM